MFGDNLFLNVLQAGNVTAFVSDSVLKGVVEQIAMEARDGVTPWSKAQVCLLPLQMKTLFSSGVKGRPSASYKRFGFLEHGLPLQ